MPPPPSPFDTRRTPVHGAFTLPFEPFRTAVVQPITLTTAQQRREALKACGNDLFRLPSNMVMVDLLTDSGTGAMSSAQWSAMMRADESYAGSASLSRLSESVARLTGIANVIPLHQGRSAERLLVETLELRPGMVVPNNAHFDTTRHMIECAGAEAMDLLPASGRDASSDAAFKGDMDVVALQNLLNARGCDVPLVMLTVTCNSNGGHPVSLANMRAVRDICDAFAKPLILDACRFADNAWLIGQRDPAHRDRCVRDIAREMFDLCDGVAMSARKDALCNAGGLLLLRGDSLHRAAQQRCVLTRGFTMTSGPLPARDLEAISVGLDESVDDPFLAQRHATIALMCRILQGAGVRIVQPVGGHAVFIDAAAFCPHLPVAHAAHALACAIYEHCGVRCTSIGSALIDPSTGDAPSLVRLAIPRRTYSASHLRYAAEAIADLRAHTESIAPRRITTTDHACIHHEMGDADIHIERSRLGGFIAAR